MKHPAETVKKANCPTVFIVDDDASMREAISRLIRSVGLNVEIFSSAKDFLQIKRGDTPHASSSMCVCPA